MAILAALATRLAQRRPTRGRVVLLYQPAEETGAGASAVIADPRFAPVRPDFAYALHNLPGLPLGQVVTRPGTFSCASRGVIVQLFGRTAHAAQPETGRSPARGMCAMIDAFDELPAGHADTDELAFATVVGARLGERAFGTAPGEASVMATVRSETDATMARLVRHVAERAARIAQDEGLQHTISYDDVFAATRNADRAVRRILRALPQARLLDKPFRWSEDFGAFTRLCEGAMFGLGAGTDGADLHNPDYDFPDALVAAGCDAFARLLDSHDLYDSPL
jgi:metal-dependent amidase/aminoacylase/carboxypeptidase family protein